MPTPSAKIARHVKPSRIPLRVWTRSTGVNDFWVGVGDDELAGSGWFMAINFRKIGRDHTLCIIAESDDLEATRNQKGRMSAPLMLCVGLNRT
jgi:hypothetical protein